MHDGSIGKGSIMTTIIPPRDLADFHLRWQEFRPTMVALLRNPELTADQIATLGWLIALSDRISTDDFED